MTGTVYQLRRGDQQATACTVGGVLSSYQVKGLAVLAGTERAEQFAFRGSLLAPWPNRVVGGRWSWEGRELHLPINDEAAGTALHGLVYDVEWAVVDHTDDRIVMRHALAASSGYPFPLELEVGYCLEDTGLSCWLTARNNGAVPAPVGLGVHPYLDARGTVDDLQISVPAATVLQTDDAWRETGRVPVGSLDFREPRLLGDLELDTAFTDVGLRDGRTECTVTWPDGEQVVLWSGPTCRWWLVYTGHTLVEPSWRRSLAIEPMTCPPDAFNSGELDVLPPGGGLTLTWGLTTGLRHRARSG